MHLKTHISVYLLSAPASGEKNDAEQAILESYDVALKEKT